MPTYDLDIGLGPGRLDHELLIGTLYRVYGYLLDEDGEPYDLTDVTAVVEVLSDPGRRVLVTADFVVTDAAAGAFYWEAPASASADLKPQPATFHLTATFPEDPDDPRTLLEGVVPLRRPGQVS